MSLHAYICNNFNSYLVVTSSIKHTSPAINYTNHMPIIYVKYLHNYIMLLVTAISILTGPNMLTVLLEYINLFQSQSQWQHKANIREELPILCHTLPYIQTLLYSQLAISIFCLNLFLLAMLSNLLFAYIFLLLLFYSKIGLSLLLIMNQIVWPYLILLDSVRMCGILKCKPTIKNIIIASFIARSRFVLSLFSYLLIGIPNRSALDFVFVVAEISQNFTLLCWHYVLHFPAPKISWDNQLKSTQPLLATLYNIIAIASIQTKIFHQPEYQLMQLVM